MPVRVLLICLLFISCVARSSSEQMNTAERPAVLEHAGDFEDLDSDSLSDTLEQALLERFLPRFFVSETECAGLPVEFAPGESKPRAIAASGTIYGQAFPIKSAASERIELHFFHLWTNDCGRFGHPLDAEHVSVLLQAPHADSPVSAWRALYWYAAAHEDTVCDVSHGAHASALKAENSGARVWISSGKHASYLDQKRCKLGCGGDQCKRMRELEVHKVVNLGEAGRPLNGAVWIASAEWPIVQKLGPDFSDTVERQLAGANPKKVVAVNSALPPVRATILAGGETLDGVATGKKHTGNALKTGKDATGNALGRAFRATGRFLNGEKPAEQTPASANDGDLVPAAESVAAPGAKPE